VVSFLVKEVRETTESQLVVETQSLEDKSGASDLLPGVHRFMLVVENDTGRQSEPMIVEVEVTRPTIRVPIRIPVVPIGIPPTIVSPAPTVRPAPVARVVTPVRPAKKSAKGTVKKTTKSRKKSTKKTASKK